jgi:hypothetical protein
MITTAIMIQYVAVDKTARPKRGKFIYSSVKTTTIIRRSGGE